MKIQTIPFATIAAVILAAVSSCETAPEQVESNVLRITAECAQTKTLLSDGHHTWATGQTASLGNSEDAELPAGQEVILVTTLKKP